MSPATNFACLEEGSEYVVKSNRRDQANKDKTERNRTELYKKKKRKEKENPGVRCLVALSHSACSLQRFRPNDEWRCYRDQYQHFDVDSRRGSEQYRTIDELQIQSQQTKNWCSASSGQYLKASSELLKDARQQRIRSRTRVLHRVNVPGVRDVRVVPTLTSECLW